MFSTIKFIYLFNLDSTAMRYIFIVFMAGLLFFCMPKTTTQKQRIILKGSDTMLMLARKWAEAYMTAYPQVAVYVEGGGSGAGLKALIDGNTDIALSSRIITPGEASQLAQKYKSIGISFIVAKDALSVYLNRENKLQTLTMGDLALIFNGDISNWLIFSERYDAILPVIRPASSGTHLFFKKHVLKEREYSSASIRLPTTKDITSFVSKNKNAIGYGGIAYGDSVFNAPINGVYPTEENVRNGSYPLSRYLYFYSIDTPSQIVRQFIDWVVSPAGQRIVNQVGYIPLWD